PVRLIEVPVPGQAAVVAAGLAVGADVDAEMRPRRPDVLEDLRRHEQQLDVDVGTALAAMAAEWDVVRQTAELYLVDDAQRAARAGGLRGLRRRLRGTLRR